MAAWIGRESKNRNQRAPFALAVSFSLLLSKKVDPSPELSE